MLQIEKEQEEYRKLMRLAEKLCMMDDYADFSSDKEKEGTELADVDILKSELLELKALCHVIDF